MPLLKLGNVRMMFPSFHNCEGRKKDLKDNKHNSLHLACRASYDKMPSFIQEMWLVRQCLFFFFVSENCQDPLKWFSDQSSFR